MSSDVLIEGLIQSQRDSLEAYFAARLNDREIRLVAWKLASQGMSDETIFATVHGCTGPTELVLRRYRADGVAREITDIERQYRLLRALWGTNIPIPEVLWHEQDESVLGTPFFVMRRVNGHVPIPWSAEGREFLAHAGDGPVGEQFVAVLAAIHQVDWQHLKLGFLPHSDDPKRFAHDEVAKLATLVRRYRQEPEPIFEDALGWMAANAPTTLRTTLVHGDYRTGNMIFDGDRIAAVLDWEFAVVGDPMLDLGWICAQSNRMDSDRVCYLLPRGLFLERYEEATGWRCDEAALHFWEVYHQVKNAMIWLTAADAWASGRTNDIRLARWSLTLPTMRRLVAELLDYPR